MPGSTEPSEIIGAIGSNRIEGVLDAAHLNEIAGWCWRPDAPGERLTLDIIVDGTVVCSVVADRPRPDVASAGKGDGGYGFRTRLPPGLSLNPVLQVRVCDRASGLEPAGSPVTLVNEAVGLDAASRRFLAARVEAMASRPLDAEWDGGEGLEETAAFLLAQFDRLLQARQRATDSRARDLARWSGLLHEQGCEGPDGVASLIDVARGLYGDGPLVLPGSETPEVSIIIPVHGKFPVTHRCLQSIADIPPDRRFEVILVDDGSTDETLLAPLLLAGVRLLRNARRLGFVGSVNAGAAIARGDHLMLLNNDTLVQPGWLDELCDTFARDATVGVAGSRLLSADGTLQECGGIIWRAGDGCNYGRGQDPERPEFGFLRDTDYVSGAALMIRRDVWDQVGGLGGEYAPGYYEDTDLCFKVREAGYRVVVQPHSRVTHLGGVTAGTDVDGAGMKRHQQINMGRFARRWQHRLASHGAGDAVAAEAEAERHVNRRALFIDDCVPTPDHDAGSTVAVEHMKSMMRLGYHVHFVPADNMARVPGATDALERIGVRCHHAPFEHSADEVLRNHAGSFDVIYLHRASNARYLALARARNPGARVIYNVADLHHLRLMREADLAGDLGLRRSANAMREEELGAVAAADCTVVHSTYEGAVLGREVPGAAVAVVRWVVPVGPPALAFADRAGVALVGSTHGPNIDAAEFLVRQVMPLVWARAPAIVLHLLGTMCDTARVRNLAGERVRLVGWVADLPAALAAMRLTIAPLRFGAGLKGKVLDSLAAGLPCVMTPVAAEGAGLPPELLNLVASEPGDLAGLVVALHGDAARNEAAGRAGRRFIETDCCEAAIDAQLRVVLSGTDQAMPDRSAVIQLAPDAQPGR